MVTKGSSSVARRVAAALLCVIGLVTLLRGAPVAAAGDRYIDPAGADSGDCGLPASPCLTLAYAVAQAAPGDIVHLAAGTYTGPGNQHVIINKALTLDGAGPAATNTIRCSPTRPAGASACSISTPAA